MTRLWWVRHGPTHQRTMTGWRDVAVDLSDTAALDRLDRYLPRESAIVSSDLIRAIQTADVLTTGRQRLPHRPDLREIDFGDWDGLHYSQVAARDPVLSRAFWEHPGDLAAPGGESWNGVTTRVAGAIDALIAAHAPDDLIVVAHMGVIMSQLPRATGQSPHAAMAHTIDPLGVTDMALRRGTWHIGQINHRP